MSLPVNVGHWLVPTLCVFLASTTLRRSLTGVALDPERSARFAEEITLPASLVVANLVAGWAVYTWRRWAPYLAVGLFGWHLFGLMNHFRAQPLALVEASLFAAGALWFLLPGVRLRFGGGAS